MNQQSLNQGKNGGTATGNEKIEGTGVENFSVPSGIGFEAYSGSMQEILRDNIGKYVEIEFLIGTTSLQTRSGILYAVGTSYVVINQLPEKMVCDIYAIKFVTFRNAATENEVRQLMQNSQSNRQPGRMRGTSNRFEGGTAF